MPYLSAADHQKLVEEAQAAAADKAKVQQLEQLLSGSSENTILLMPRPPPIDQMNVEALKTKLRALNLPDNGRKEVLVARIETSFTCTSVIANRVTLEGASDALRQLVTSSADGRLEMPTGSVEAIRLVWLALLSGVETLKSDTSKGKMKELALELTVLADQLGLDAIAEAGARCIAEHHLLQRMKPTGNNTVVAALFQAAEQQHPTAGTVWDKVRGQVAFWLNTCECRSCKKRSGPSFSCRIGTCGIERLSYESLVKLVGYLPVERAAASAAEQFEWVLPGSASMLPGASKTFPAMTHCDFNFSLRVRPNGDGAEDSRPKFYVVAQGSLLHRFRGQWTTVVGKFHPQLGNTAYTKSGCYNFQSTLDEDGTLRGTHSLQLTKSTARRDMLLQWAGGNGLPTTERTEAALLQFFASNYSLNEVVSSALLCHMAPAFCVTNAAQFAQLPATVMAGLLGRDDLDVTTESEVVEALKPWIDDHTTTELQQLVPSLRLAWIPTKELLTMLTTGVLAPLKDNDAVQQLVEDALDAQTISGGKRRRQAEGTPDQFMCPITQDTMTDPVIAADGHCYERVAIARWLVTHDTSPKTNLVLQHMHLTPNHGLKSLILQHTDQLNACEQRVNKRAKFATSEIPQASRLDLLTSR